MTHPDLKRTAVLACWALTSIALIFTGPRPPFTLLDRFSESHSLFLLAFFVSSLYLFGNYKHRAIGLIHFATISVVLILHPYSPLFGRDGTPIICGVYILLFILYTPLFSSERKLLATTILLCVVLIEVLLPKWMERQLAVKIDVKEWADFVDGYNLHEGGYLLPQVDAQIAGEFGVSQFTTNSAGFRYSKDIDYKTPQDTFRIILIGDSFAVGYRTDQADTIGRALQDGLHHALNKNRVEVLTAGVHDTAWAARYIDDFAFRFDPDLIAIGITLGNDISGTYVTASGQRFSDAAIQNSFLPEAAFDVSGLRGAGLRLHRNLSSWEIYRLVRRTIRDDPIISYYGDYPLRVHTFDIYHALGHFYSGSEIEIVSASFLALEQTLLRIKTLCEQNSIPLLVVLFPQRFQIRARDWQHTLFYYGLDKTKFEVDRPNESILKFCERNQITCLDTLPGLRQSAARTLYFPRGDMHLNKTGQRVTAESIQQFVVRSGVFTAH